MKMKVFAAVMFVCSLFVNLSAGAELELDVMRFEEGRTVKFEMVPTSRASAARMKAQVKYQEGQQHIELEYKDLKPAVLFGGDITCYVLWAINRDGTAQNLGELWVRPDSNSEKLEFSTGLRNFALLVTAESYYQIEAPSDFAVFQNASQAKPNVGTDPLAFSAVLPAAKHFIEELSPDKYDGEKPIDLLQAEAVLRIATEEKAEDYAPQL